MLLNAHYATGQVDRQNHTDQRRIYAAAIGLNSCSGAASKHISLNFETRYDAGSDRVRYLARPLLYSGAEEPRSERPEQ